MLPSVKLLDARHESHLPAVSSEQPFQLSLFPEDNAQPIRGTQPLQSWVPEPEGGCVAQNV